MEQPVSGVSGLSGKIELGGQEAPPGTLDPEMKMARSTGIKCGHDGVEPPASLRVGELVSAQAEPHAVIVAVLIGLPDLDEATAEWPAARVEYEPCDGYPFAVG